jgi:hypothetical protein
MENNTPNLPEIERFKALGRERAEILSLPPEKAVDRILEQPQPTALVHSFPEEDLYFLIHDIGVEDALPLLALASQRQLDFILDLEIWEKDRINFKTATRWFSLMMAADPKRFVEWLAREKTELLEFYLFRNLEIRIREHDEDPSDFGDDFNTFDNVYYYRFLPESPLAESADGNTDSSYDEEYKKDVIHKILTGLADLDLTNYQNIILESLVILPADAEEDAYRWKNIRLAEKGFLPFDEAVGIYQSMSLDDLQAVGKRRFSSDPFAAPPLTPFNLMKEDFSFSEALVHISFDERINKIQGELAFLCNAVIVADQRTIRTKEDLQAVVKKVCGYLHIALELFSEKKAGAPDDAKNLLSFPLSHIFRVGYGKALSLKWDAKRWMEKSWFSSNRLPLSFWGEEGMGVLGGLLIKKPLFYDNYHTGVLYREFSGMNDIQKTMTSLNNIIAWDTLLSLTGFNIERLAPQGRLTYKNIFLTQWAVRYLGAPNDPGALPVKEFHRFYQDLWEPGTKPGKIKESMKSDFLEFLSVETGLEGGEISRQAGLALEDLFKELENEYGDVSPENLDPRLMPHFLLKS